MKKIHIFIAVMFIANAIHSSSFANAVCENGKWDKGGPKVAIDLIGQAIGILPEVPPKEAGYLEREDATLIEHSHIDEHRYAALTGRPYYYIWQLTKELNAAREDFYKISDATEKTALTEKLHLATRSITDVIRVVSANDDFQKHAWINEHTPKFVNAEYLARLNGTIISLSYVPGSYINCLADNIETKDGMVK